MKVLNSEYTTAEKVCLGYPNVDVAPLIFKIEY